MSLATTKHTAMEVSSTSIKVELAYQIETALTEILHTMMVELFMYLKEMQLSQE